MGRATSLLPHSFYPPYNRISRYREPGWININTIGDDGYTWQAILDNDSPRRIADAHWRKVFISRQGYGGLTPVRSAAAAHDEP